MDIVQLNSPYGLVELIDENDESDYPAIHSTCGVYRPSSSYGVLLRGERRLRLDGGAGATRVHARSAVLVDDAVVVAVGNHLISVELQHGMVRWATQVDYATCFGVYRDGDALISHGELEIARVSLQGDILWSAGGPDILTGDFCVSDGVVSVVDFNGLRLRFDSRTGNVLR